MTLVEIARRRGRARHNQRQRNRKRALRAAGLCVNAYSHGAAVCGGRCAACWQRKVETQRDAERRLAQVLREIAAGVIA